MAHLVTRLLESTGMRADVCRIDGTGRHAGEDGNFELGIITREPLHDTDLVGTACTTTGENQCELRHARAPASCPRSGRLDARDQPIRAADSPARACAVLRLMRDARSSSPARPGSSRA